MTLGIETMDLLVEKARPADAAAILEYLKKVGAETDNLNFGGEGLPVSVEAEAEFIAGLADSHDGIMLVARADGEIVGDASLSRQPRRMGHRGALGISVLKQFWGQGVGTRLLSGIVKFAKENGFEIIELQVRSDNERAICLYKKFGFVRLCTYPDYLRVDAKPAACDFMYLRLNGSGNLET